MTTPSPSASGGMRDGAIDWLLDSDPAIRWQTLRDVVGRPVEEWGPIRASVETVGWGARLLDLEDPDGCWAGGAHFPADFAWPGPEAFQGPGRPWLGEGQPWTSTSHVLSLLREFGLPPDSDRMRRSIELIGANCRWEYEARRYWEGEVEPCINGALVANGTYFGVDMEPVVGRLVDEVLDDGGWNCEAENGSTRSSFHTTINVIEGLLGFEQATGGTTDSRAARRSGEEFLLERSLFKRLATDEAADERFLLLTHPSRWFYHVLRGLEYFRAAALADGARPDPRLAEAISHIRSRRRDDGRWNLDWSPPGRVWFDIDDGEHLPSKWVTLQALRTLDWWDAEEPARPVDTTERDDRTA